MEELRLTELGVRTVTGVLDYRTGRVPVDGRQRTTKTGVTQTSRQLMVPVRRDSDW